MPYISTQSVAAIRQALKVEFGRRFKFSVRNERHMAVEIAILEGCLPFEPKKGGQFCWQLGNEYGPEESAVLARIKHIAKTAPADAGLADEWYEESFPSADYFNTAWFIRIRLGRWQQPYRMRP